MSAFKVDKDKIMCQFSEYVAFSKTKNGQTDIKNKKDETLISMPLLKIAVEMLPSSQRSSLETHIHTHTHTEKTVTSNCKSSL